MKLLHQEEPILWTLASELHFSVLSFVDGRGLSSFVEALLASKSRRSFTIPLVKYLMKRWHDEIVQILTPNTTSPQPALVSFVKETMIARSAFIDAAPNNNSNAAVVIRQFSEWCILFDYVMQGPRSAPSFSSRQMLWPVGVGVFATTPVCGGNRPLQTKVVLSLPVWNPMAVLLCHDIWLSSKNEVGLVGAPTHFSWLPSEGDIDGFHPNENIGILTPFDDTNVRTFCATQALTRSDDFLPAMGRPDSCLSILPALDCPIYGPLVDHMVRSSSRHEWILEQHQQSNQLSMLCFFDSHRKYSSDSNHSQTSLGDRIIHLMKTWL